MPILLDSMQTRAPLQLLFAIAQGLANQHDTPLFGAMVAVHGAFPFRLDKPLRVFTPDMSFERSFALPFEKEMARTLDIEPILPELAGTVAHALMAEEEMKKLIGKGRPMLVLNRNANLFTSVTSWPDRGPTHAKKAEQHPLTRMRQVLVVAVHLELALMDKELWMGGMPEDF